MRIPERTPPHRRPDDAHLDETSGHVRAVGPHVPDDQVRVVVAQANHALVLLAQPELTHPVEPAAAEHGLDEGVDRELDGGFRFRVRHDGHGLVHGAGPAAGVERDIDGVLLAGEEFPAAQRRDRARAACLDIRDHEGLGAGVGEPESRRMALRVGDRAELVDGLLEGDAGPVSSRKGRWRRHPRRLRGGCGGLGALVAAGQHEAARQQHSGSRGKTKHDGHMI
jgi:hypothetical protein